MSLEEEKLAQRVKCGPRAGRLWPFYSFNNIQILKINIRIQLQFSQICDMSTSNNLNFS